MSTAKNVSTVDFPDDWEIRPLGEVVKPTRPRIKPAEKPHLPFIGMEHIEAHTMKLLGTVPARTMKSSAVHFQPGDVLYGRLRPYLNKVYRPDFEGLCSAEFIVFPKTQGIDSRYLQYFLNSSAFVSYASHLNTGDRPRVDFDQLAPYQFPVAPVEQQKRIVAEIEKQFSRLDEAVGNLKRVKANLKRYKAAVLKAAVEGKLTEEWRKQHPEVEPARELLKRMLAERRGESLRSNELDLSRFPEAPKGWLWCRLGQLGQVIGGLTKNVKRDAYPLKLPYLRVANVYANELRLGEMLKIGVREEEIERALLRKGDLLVVEGNGSRDQIGRLAIWDGSIEPCLHQNHLIKVRLVKRELGPFILWWLLSSSGRGYVVEVASSTSGLYTLSISKVGSLPVPLPPLEEQRVITAEVDSRMSLANAINAELDANVKRANRLRQSILREAFKGQLTHDNPTLFREGSIGQTFGTRMAR